MASTQTVTSVDPKYYVWWFPGSPVKVHLDLQLVKRLQQRILAPGAGPAEGGLLFGGAKDGCSEILDFQSIPFAGVAGAVAALPPERRNSLIGYYRTEPSESFHLEARDRSLVEQCFSSPHHVFLMVHPNGFGRPRRRFSSMMQTAGWRTSLFWSSRLIPPFWQSRSTTGSEDLASWPSSRLLWPL